MKLKLRIQIFLASFAPFAGWFRPRGIALGNAVGLAFGTGKESLQIDPTATLPVGTKYLVYVRGSTQYLAKPSSGGSAAPPPLGISPDAAFQAGDFISVERFNATVGTQLGVSAGAITIDHLVYDAGATTVGTIGDLTTAGNGTYFVIGRATATVTAAGQQISFIPTAPYLLTVTGGVFTNPANPL
jgi:hypothetical protein